MVSKYDDAGTKALQAGYITYMRTDSTNVSEEAVKACRDHISSAYGANYLPIAPNSFSTKKSAQEAHEAIRPTDIARSEDFVASQVSPEAARLYQMIWNQFVASQMKPALYDLTKITVQCGDFELTSKGRILKFDGFLRVQSAVQKKNDQQDLVLPDVKPGEVLDLEGVEPSHNISLSLHLVIPKQVL